MTVLLISDLAVSSAQQASSRVAIEPSCIATVMRLTSCVNSCMLIATMYLALLLGMVPPVSSLVRQIVALV